MKLQSAVGRTITVGRHTYVATETGWSEVAQDGVTPICSVRKREGEDPVIVAVEIAIGPYPKWSEGMLEPTTIEPYEFNEMPHTLDERMTVEALNDYLRRAARPSSRKSSARQSRRRAVLTSDSRPRMMITIRRFTTAPVTRIHYERSHKPYDR